MFEWYTQVFWVITHSSYPSIQTVQAVLNVALYHSHFARYQHSARRTRARSTLMIAAMTDTYNACSFQTPFSYSLLCLSEDRLKPV